MNMKDNKSDDTKMTALEHIETDLNEVDTVVEKIADAESEAMRWLRDADKASKGIRYTTLALGILMIVAGIFLFATPVINSSVAAYLVCILMLVFGVTEIFHFIKRRKAHVTSGWVLADGVITIAITLALIFLPGTQIMTMGYVFAFWLIFTSVTRVTAFVAAKDHGPGGWSAAFVVGLVGFILGAVALLNPMYGILAIGYVIPVIFIMQGISAIAVFISTNKKA